MYKRGAWRVWQTSCTMLQLQTTTETELCEGSKWVDTALSGVLVLNYRLEHFIMTHVDFIIQLVI